jgi:MoaA/NifB/PqqE/SkfB family radical SAM enzyme
MPRGAASVERRAPDLGRYLALDRDVKNRWADRERGRLRRIVRPALAWTSAQTASRRVQIVPCKAGVLSAVVYANGDVSVCETVLSHPILGNLRERSFRELWHSPQAQKARTMIRTRQCACTNEVFLSPSVTFQPAHLVRALVRSKVRPQP